MKPSPVYRCRCGWRIYTDRPLKVTCRKCGRTKTYGVVGLGDHIAVVLDALGGRWLKALYKRLFGRECGCDERRKALNGWGSKVRSLCDRVFG